MVGVVDRDHRQHARLGVVGRVADELGDAELLDHLAVGVEPVDVGGGALASRLGALALRRHLALEPGQVDVDRALAGDLLRELEREAVRVVEQERGRARQAGRRRRARRRGSTDRS